MHNPAQCNIVTGVGFTALGVAAVRAMETHRHSGGLVSDPYAEAFVQAATLPVLLPTRLDTEVGATIPWDSIATYIGVRSRFFDEFFGAASAEGLNQVVLLAAGLDSRAFRLDWLPTTTVYELDAPEVLAFKARVLTDQGAQTRCMRRTVAVDLREGWGSALVEAGFDPSRRAVWLAEGLLPYLPDDAKITLFSQVHELSPAGSRIAVEHISEDLATLRKEIERMAEQMTQWIAERSALDVTETALVKSAAELWPGKQHFDPARWLAAHGWEVSTNSASTLAHSYGRRLGTASPLFHRSSLFITAQAL